MSSWDTSGNFPQPRSSNKGWLGDCFYCGLYYEHLTVDHIIPKSKGRQFDRPWNTVWVCSFCNHKKADHSLADWLDLVAAMTPSEFGHGPRHRGIVGRREIIKATLMKRPEMHHYPGQIGVFRPRGF